MLYEKSLTIERRLGDLVQLIRSERHSTPSLAQKLGVSIPTISRDIMALRERGFDIRPLRGQTGWFYRLAKAKTCPQIHEAKQQHSGVAG